jgi:hypothetical protein
MDAAYDSQDCEIFSVALQYGCEMFLKQARLARSDVDVAKGALAYAILDAAKNGERNPRRLAIHAVATVDKHLPRIDFERRCQANALRITG